MHVQGYLFLDICSSKLTVFLELRSGKTVLFSEQITFTDKYPSIFSRQMATIVYIFSRHMEAIVFIILQTFFATSKLLKTMKYLRIFPSFSWEIFGHVACLDQSRTSENVWWIIMLKNPHNISTTNFEGKASLFSLISYTTNLNRSCPWCQILSLLI